MSIYLICIYFLIGMLAVLTTVCVSILIFNRKKSKRITMDNLKQKKSSLYIKYNLKSKNIVINNYTYLNLDISKSIVSVSEKEDFVNNVKRIVKNVDEKFEYKEQNQEFVFNLTFSFREKINDDIILRCDYDIERKTDAVELRAIDDIKLIHKNSKDKNAVFYYLNIKDFNSLNQRYGQECGDYILEIIKTRLLKMQKNNIHCSYIGSDQFAIYRNKCNNKKKALKFIKQVNKKLSKSIDIGYIDINLVFGIGLCVGKYRDLDEFIKGAYVAADYAKKRKNYSIVIYNDGMKSEENIMSLCEDELDNILETKEINITYYPVFYNKKSKFVGYISSINFDNKLIDYNKVKSVALQKDKIDQLMSTVIDEQLIDYLKKRPMKTSKLFINLHLEDLATFLEVYLSNPSYSDCKIVICLDVKKGYEMINKFPNISSNISKIIEEGIEFALTINYSNMYDYDYILKNANYLILDNNIVSNMNNTLIKNKVINIIELAQNYELDLFAIDIKEYIQFENLIKSNTCYFSGPYFGKGAKRPNEIEQSKTRIFTKFAIDSKKNKKIS